MSTIRLAVVGAGNMAQAILRGAFDTGVLTPQETLVADPAEAQRSTLASWGANVTPTAASFAGAIASDTQIMLAVKPQFLAEAAQDLGSAADNRVIISILAGSTSERIRDVVGGNARIVRTMPNLPARIRKGITAVALGAGAVDGDDDFAQSLFRAVGEVISIDESLMDAFTGIAGSGPAYVFYLAEAMCKAGVRMGFSEAEALGIVRATIDGAATLLAQSDDDPAALRAAVTSKKGTTDAAITSLDQSGVMAAIERAVIAARDRGAELAAM